MKQLGPSGNDAAKHFTDYLKKCNITSNLPVVPSIALGSCEISLYEMMQAYSMFPGRGFNAKPFFITRIEDRNGNVLQTYMPQRVDVISDVTATYVVDMMQGVIEKGTGRRMRAYGVRGEVAGKTGTTNDNSDAWFMGYTPQLLCGVWTGCDDRFVRFSSTNLGQGSSVALPVWAYFYQKASADKRLGLDVNAKFSKAEGIMAGAIGQYKFEQAQDVNENEAAADGQGSSEEYGLPGSTPQTPQPNNNNNNGGYELRPNEQRPPANTPKKQR
jgi:penicillin-binding protein 1A